MGDICVWLLQDNKGEFWIMQNWLKIKGRLQDIWTEMNVHIKMII